MLTFTTVLWRHHGPAAWTFVTLPADARLPPPGPFGRIPVRATVDGRAWSTSVWRGRDQALLLAVPRRYLGAKVPGDTVDVEIAPDPSPR